MPSDVELVVRPALQEDADALATLLVTAREAAHPAMPRGVHPPEDVRRWMRSRLEAPAAEVWVAERDTGLAGLLILEHDWLHSIYVDPRLAGQGIGATLLEVAKSRRPDGLGLWVFQSNDGARRFYLRHGFGEVRRTDGSDNEEGQPDIEMAWPDPATLAGMRRAIDVLDDRLAELLEERARLTAAVQRLKDVPGHAGRDPDREDQIVARMARLAPSLGDHRLHRIMHAVISESLDAAEGDLPSGPDGPGQDAPGSPGAPR